MSTSSVETIYSHDDVSLPVAHAGKQGDHLVLVHGAVADHRMWCPHMARLAGRFRVHAPTQRHFGKASGSSKPFGINTHASDLVTMLAAIDGEPKHVVAWSYGADVALAAALQAPEHFVSLFLYEPGFPGYLDEAAMQVFSHDAGTMFGPIFAAVEQGEMERSLELLIDGSGNREGYFASQSAENRQIECENLHTLTLQLQQSEQPPLNAETLQDLTVPAWIGHGSNTRDLFRVVTEAAARLVTGRQPSVVAGANHMLPMEDPEQFCEQVEEFVVDAETGGRE